jgi:hypothetical protein
MHTRTPCRDTKKCAYYSSLLVVITHAMVNPLVLAWVAPIKKLIAPQW